jgi:DNA mismatch repair protein MLH1
MYNNNISRNILLKVNTDRLVNNSRIKKEIKQVYNNIRIGYTPRFIYISLNVKPSDIDVNIHPTKNEAGLL